MTLNLLRFQSSDKLQLTIFLNPPRHSAEQKFPDFLSQKQLGRVISRLTDRLRPAHCPVLSPLEYWFWSKMDDAGTSQKSGVERHFDLKNGRPEEIVLTSDHNFSVRSKIVFGVKQKHQQRTKREAKSYHQRQPRSTSPFQLLFLVNGN